MEALSMIVNLVMIIILIIIIVKFFQIASDVREIKNSLNVQKDYSTNSAVENDETYQIGSLIVEKKTEKQMRIIGIDENNGKFQCSNTNGVTFVWLSGEEIELFDIYVKNLNK